MMMPSSPWPTMGKTRMEIDKVLLDVIYEHTIHTTWRGVNRDLEEMNVMYGRYSTVVAVAVVVVEARTLR